MQYPLWRPPAQWSKTLGFSHTGDFNLFSLGEVNKDYGDYIADDHGCAENKGYSKSLE